MSLKSENLIVRIFAVLDKMCIRDRFIYNAICVMSDQLTSKAGTITSGEDRFMEWKTKDGKDVYKRQFLCCPVPSGSRPYR